MKKNDWVLTAAVAIYSYLFYNQSLGINFLIFTVSIIALLFLRKKEVIKSRNWIFASIGSLLSAACIAYYGNDLSLAANIISLAILSAFSINPNTSIITSFLFSVYSISASYIFVILDTIVRAQKKEPSLENKYGMVKFMLYLVPIIIVVIFFFIYKASNPLFDNFTKKINLDFISMAWILFTLGGFFLMYGFFYHKNIKMIARNDENASDNLLEENSECENRFLNLSVENETKSGIILFMLLNLLLLSVNVLDINFLWFDGTLPKDLSYSQFVHQGTGMLITSIVIAIAVILFYFRGTLNFYEKNKFIKLLAYLWVLQNAFMIISTAFRNQLYINEYCLTYKRLGVYIYLLLALIGLFTTFIKIWKTKSNWYLFRTNGWLFYSVIILSCFFNWDLMVTDFNIQGAENKHKPLDKNYLVSLSYNNIPQLLTLNETIIDSVTYDEHDLFSRSYSNSYYAGDYKVAMNFKLYKFLGEMQDIEWKSFCFEKKYVYENVVSLKNDLTVINLQNYYLQTLKPLSLLDNLHSLNFSGNLLKDPAELKQFPVLEDLNLSNNNLDSLDYFPMMDKLKILNLSNNNLKKIYQLKNTPNLVMLDLTGNHDLDLKSIPATESLTSLTLNNVDVDDFSPLLRLPNLTELNIMGVFTTYKNGTRLPFLPKLTRLNIQNNYLMNTDTVLFQSLVSSLGIECLNLADNQLENLYPITSYFNLKKSTDNKEKITPLFSSLKILDVSRNKLNSLYPLFVYPDLEVLSVSGNPLTNLFPLEQLTSLKSLYIDNCGLKNIEFLKKLKKLETLNISGNYISDYSPIYELKNLKYLYVGPVSKKVSDQLKKIMPKTNIVATIVN